MEVGVAVGVVLDNQFPANPDAQAVEDKGTVNKAEENCTLVFPVSYSIASVKRRNRIAASRWVTLHCGSKVLFSTSNSDSDAI